ASGRIQVDPRDLGELTVSVLQGEHGHQRKEVVRLVSWLKRHAQPGLVNLSNVLIAGCVPQIKRHLQVPILVTLQGDDLFLEELSQPYKKQALDLIRGIAEHIDGFVVPNRFYAEFMSEYLSLDPRKFHIVPLGINLDDYAQPSDSSDSRAPTIGYL